MRPKSVHESSSLTTRLLAVAIVALAGCDRPQTPQAPAHEEAIAPAEAETKSLELLDNPGWEAFDARIASIAGTPAITYDDLKYGKVLFRGCFRSNPGQPITRDSVEIPWSEFIRDLPPAAAGIDRAVFVHYGLNSPALHLGWSFRLVSENRNIYGYYDMTHPVPHRIYEWEDGARTTTSYDTWIYNNQQRHNGRSYFSQAEVNRLVRGVSIDHWDDVRDGDTEACVLHWEERLQKLYDHNEPLFRGRENHLYLVVHSTGDFRLNTSGDEKMRHTIAVHLRIKEPNTPVVNLIGDGQPDATYPFRMRGANYGNLCPVRCNEYER